MYHLLIYVFTKQLSVNLLSLQLDRCWIGRLFSPNTHTHTHTPEQQVASTNRAAGLIQCSANTVTDMKCIIAFILFPYLFNFPFVPMWTGERGGGYAGVARCDHHRPAGVHVVTKAGRWKAPWRLASPIPLLLSPCLFISRLPSNTNPSDASLLSCPHGQDDRIP